MKDIIYILTPMQSGGNFVDWSMNYLMSETHLSRNHSDITEITHEPCTNINAHDHYGRCCTSIEQIDRSRQAGSKVIYYHPAEEFNEISEIIDSIHNVILLSNKYNKNYSVRLDRSKLDDQKTIINELLEWHLHHNKAAIDKFTELDLYDLSIFREFLAMTSEDIAISDNYVNIKKYNTFILDTRELYTTFDIIIHEIFAFFGLVIDQKRWDNWKVQYDIWKNIQYAQNKFSINFDRIIDFTLRGINYNLAPFKLDVMQEALILRTLINKGLYLPSDCEYNNTKNMFNNLENLNGRELPIIKPA